MMDPSLWGTYRSILNDFLGRLNAMGWWTIRLERYPEVRASLERGSVVLVEDVRTSSLMGPWAQLAATHGGNSIISVPLFVHNRAIGALLLRATDKAPAFGARAGLE